MNLYPNLTRKILYVLLFFVALLCNPSTSSSEVITIKPRHLSLLKSALQRPSGEQSDLWKPMTDQGWSPCIDLEDPPSLPDKTIGYIQVFLDGGLNQQRMGICDAVAVAKILNATLVIPFLEVNPVWQDSSSFVDIFDVDHFINALKDDIRVVKELPDEYSWSTREYYATAVRETRVLGRVWVVWKEGVRVTPIYKSNQMITCAILLEGKEEEFFCSFIYASNQMEERRDLWGDLRYHHDSPLFKNQPWMVCGDFNETLRYEEHSNYLSSPTLSAGMQEFQNVVGYCSLVDLGHQGPTFTWGNKRSEGMICKKLDRMMVNDVWMQKYPSSYGVFEAGGCSDHLRGRIVFETQEEKKRKPFKFANVLVKLPQFGQIVEEEWKTSPPLFISTSALHRFSKKLKSLKPALRNLGNQSLSDISRRTREAHASLCEKQMQTLMLPTADAAAAESEAYNKWHRLSEIEEEFLKQRAKLHWLSVGDGNNKVFHRAVQVRKMRNTIREIKDHNGEVKKGTEEIKTEAVRFFQEFLTHTPEEYTGMSTEQIQQLLQFRCSEIDKEQMLQEVTEEEIHKTLFSMPNDKSPGPDGYTSEFFKAAWPTVGKDFTAAIQSFFVKGFLPKGVNTTILALIPKKEEASTMKDYRPISCCNVLYKVISKILANRLKAMLPKFIAQNQSAFVKERLLMENVLLASEVVKDYHKSDVSPRCAMKIDISKAFDSVQWSFLLNVLAALDFPEKFIHWIRLCISTASFSIQVNGELAGFFKSDRGLRQETRVKTAPVHASAQWYIENVSPLLYSYGIAAISPFSHRLSFDHLPAEIQRLRCKVNFQALRFVPHITSLGDALVSRLRNPLWRSNKEKKNVDHLEDMTNSPQSRQQPGKFAVLHLRFDKDMAAHSACDFGGGKPEKLALAKYRQMIWQGRVLNSQFTDEELRSQGRCPLTPEEMGLLLAAFGFDNNTRLYLASHKVYGGEARISALRQVFPRMEDKRSLASSEERARIKGKASLLAALDYYVSMHSDVFISASPGNMHNALAGHRTFENLKTIRPNMALIGQLFLNKSITWVDFQQAIGEGHVNRQGQIRLRKPKQSIYTYPAPDCMCHV